MDIEILSATEDNKSYGLCKVTQQTNIRELRKIIHEVLHGPAPQSQLLRLEAKNGRTLNNEETIGALKLKNGDKIYLKDLGRQISWCRVFVAEYLGAFLIYQWSYAGRDYKLQDEALVVDVAAACMALHYLKRLYETLYVHRFSHETMPLRNLFRNCAYYWGFTAFMAWEINGAVYVSHSSIRLWTTLLIFLVCELGNYSVHLALRNLRTPGSRQRGIPMPTRNIFTQLFRLVSCPNYTYEIGVWFAFAVMTSSLISFLFALLGAYQMSKWALNKHMIYLNEFENYPKHRRAIIPYIL